MHPHSPGSNHSDRPVVAFSCGDLNGIGLPHLVQLFADNRLYQHCTPLCYASGKVLGFYRKALGLQDWTYQNCPNPQQVQPRKFNLIQCWNEDVQLQPGEANPALAQYATLSLRKATEDLLASKVQALVTLPIDKNLMQSDQFRFAGHTEFLEAEVRRLIPSAREARSLMWLVSDRLRVATLTGHLPLQEVAGQIGSERLETKLLDMAASLELDFAVRSPRIAVLGLNPHAGDGGLLGKEEQAVIAPTVLKLRGQGHWFFGPYGADGFWGSGAYKQFDAVLGMYHDQVLIPFKTLAFDQGVNFTAGLPVLRTSPDHGPAFDLAAKQAGNPSSLLHAVFEVLDRYKTRREQLDLRAHALQSVSKPSDLEHGED